MQTSHYSKSAHHARVRSTLLIHKFTFQFVLLILNAINKLCPITAVLEFFLLLISHLVILLVMLGLYQICPATKLYDLFSNLWLINFKTIYVLLCSFLILELIKKINYSLRHEFYIINWLIRTWGSYKIVVRMRWRALILARQLRDAF